MNSVLATISGDYAALIQKALPLQVNTAPSPSLPTPRVSCRLRTTHRPCPAIPASGRRRSYFYNIINTPVHEQCHVVLLLGAG